MRMCPGQPAVKGLIKLTVTTPAFLGCKVKRSQHLSRTPTFQMFTYPTLRRASCTAIASLRGLGRGGAGAWLFSCPWPQPGLPGWVLFPRALASGREPKPEKVRRGRAAGTGVSPGGGRTSFGTGPGSSLAAPPTPSQHCSRVRRRRPASGAKGPAATEHNPQR